MNQELLQLAKSNAQQWLDGNYNDEIKEEVKDLLDKEDPSELVDSFYKSLEFGTGGLRGLMGVGTNRMNIYTVGAATQGFANYLNKTFAGEDISVCIGFDCRINNKLFANTTADVFTANGIKVYIFEDLRPTPEISFAIRALGCKGGVIITASHNPKEYNGYKAYFDDGSQLVPPHDKNVIEEVSTVSLEDIKFDGNDTLKVIIGDEMDKKYLKAVKELSINPDIISSQKDLKIVFSPLHGATHKIVPDSLKNYGFEKVYVVPEQSKPDGNFPTVKYANPEEKAAFKLAIDLAKNVDADLVLACDPDGDRLGVGAKDSNGEWFLFNGNQTAALFTYYIITNYKEKDWLKGNEYIGKTIVTSEILKKIAEANGINSYDTYTGFKWIAELIRTRTDETYLCGGEESYGFLVGTSVRDKDAVSACSIISEIAAWAKSKGTTLLELLQDIYIQYGFSWEDLVSVNKSGVQGAEEIKQMMHDLRYNYPEEFGGQKVIRFLDYSTLIDKNLETGKENKIHLSTTSNVLQFYLEDGSKLSVRPSGTEPKIKFYLEVKDKINSRSEYDKIVARAQTKINGILDEIVNN